MEKEKDGLIEELRRKQKSLCVKIRKTERPDWDSLVRELRNVENKIEIILNRPKKMDKGLRILSPLVRHRTFDSNLSNV